MISNRGKKVRIICSLVIVLAVALMPLADISDSSAQAAEPPEGREAPMLPPREEPLPPGTGGRPPVMDLSHLTGQTMPHEFLAQAQVPPASWDWRTQGKVTSVKDQNPCGSCYAFASVANVESKMLIDGAATLPNPDYSENNAKECNWRELNNYQSPPGNWWGSCDGGNYYMLASLFSQKGVVLESCDPYVASDVDCNDACPYQKTLLDWRIISGNAVPNTDVLKSYIQTYGPVYTMMYTDSSQGFDGSYEGSYTFNYWTPPADGVNHCVLIVGWSNNLPPVPGDTGPADGWIVKNSWDTWWGDEGYFYITYGSANIGMYSSFMYDWQDYDNNGDIMYYDDDCWSSARGWGDTTAWGLVKFFPTSDTNVTRVEFWTTDKTTDVDVYLYDNFDGTTLSNKLWESLNHSFNEAGYHGVVVDPPLAVTSGDDVIAVVKFTNDSYGYPVPADKNGAIETGRTYLSHTGADGTWNDLAGVGRDVAIRLRTSQAVGAPDITVSPPSFNVTQAPNTTKNYTLTISNDGNATLTYTISDRETTGGVSVAGGESLFLTEPASMVLEVPLEGSPVVPENTGEAQSGWQNIMTEDFEGAFPGVWDVRRSAGYTDAYWGKDSYNKHSGSWSAFCAKSGNAGVNPPNNYPNNMKAWMIYGPFSLVDATDAEMNFWFWVDSQKDHDYFSTYASTDGEHFYGERGSGNTEGWVSDSFDLTDVYTLDNLCGRPQVWIAFMFESNYWGTDKGAFIDDVVLRQYVTGVNNPPNPPSNPSPADHDTGVSTPVTLSVLVSDPDDDAMTVTFYDASDDSVIGTDTSVASGSRAEVIWSGLDPDTPYSWYAKACDSEPLCTQSDTWEFATRAADCLWLDEEPKSGSVNPSGSDHITVTINTTGLASDYSAEIIISSNDPGDPEVVVPVTLHVGEVQPDIRTPIAPVAFGYVIIGDHRDKTTTIYNDGNAALTINSITRISGSSEFSHVSPATPFNITAGASQNITMKFAPSSKGSKNATFNVNSNDPDEDNVTFDVSGNGLTPGPHIALSQTSFDVTLSPDTTQNYTLTISNVGDAPLSYNITDKETSGSSQAHADETALEAWNTTSGRANLILLDTLIADTINPNVLIMGASSMMPSLAADNSANSSSSNEMAENKESDEGKDSKALPHASSQTQGLGSVSYESDLLKITVGEQASSGWHYQYDPIDDPGNFIRSVYGEHYAVATDTWGSVIRSTYFDIDTYFESEEAPDTAILHYGDLQLTRQVDPPVGSARSFSITFVLTNTGDSTLENVRFFQGVDYDIFDAANDYAWYSESSDTVWQNDDNYFKNGFRGSRTSSHHDCNRYSSMWSDMHSGQLNDLTKYPESGTADCGIALQWDAGDLAPQASWDLTITFYFGEAAGIEANAGPDQTVGRGQPVTFDASGSSSVGTITTYEWDLDNDGEYDVSVGTPIYVYEEGWTELGEYIVGLKVTDDEARTDTDTVKITVVLDVDLTVSNITFTPTTEISDGDIVVFNATVENIGTEAITDDFYVRFEIDDSHIGRKRVTGGLAAGGTVQVLQDWEADAGNHTVSVYADRGYYSSENNLIQETNETNNKLSQALPEILSPDLTITNLVWSPTEDIDDGDTVIFNATIRNIGGSTSRDFYVRFEIDGSYIGHQIVSGLAADGDTTVVQEWIACAGSHNVTVFADEYHAITESDETNNRRSEALPLIPLPDLTITNITWTPTGIVGGDTVTFNATVENIGAGGSSRDFYVRFEVDGKNIGHKMVSGLDSGSSEEVAQTWTATWANTVNVTADEYNEVAESDETNNGMSKALPGLPFPDLVVTNLTWSPKENLSAGDPITFTATIENTGGTFSTSMGNPLKVAFLVNDEHVGSRNIVGGLLAGHSLNTTFTWTAQAVTNPEVCIKADYSNIIPESNEDNNELCETLTLVIKSPDLTITQVTFAPTGDIHVGDIVEFTAEVENTGEGNYSGDFDVGFYVNDAFAGVSHVANGLPAGESIFSTFNWTASSCSNPAIKAKADFFDVVQESDETNNERTETLPASIPYADLEISGINWTPTENIKDRDPVVFNVTVKNNGPENVTTDFKVYFDIDGYFTRNNLISGGLAAGESKTTSFTWKATPGGGHNATAKADPDNIVPESNEGNNEFTQLLPFDVSLVEIFEVKVEPAELTTGIGGQTNCQVKINNHGSASATFVMTVSGLDSDWFTLSETSIFLSSGQEGIVKVAISVPEACENSGTFPFQVSVTSQETGITQQGSANLIVEPTPVIHDLLPKDGASLGSNDVTFSWNTYINATTEVYLKSEDESEYTAYAGEDGLTHVVTVSDLTRDTHYSYYAESTSPCGSSNSTIRTFYIGNGISFTQDVYEFTVEKDYNQRVTIGVRNTDNEYHELLVEVPITYEDLVLGFVGEGSQDNIIPLNPGESKDITLAIHLQDAMEEDYELTAELTSTKGEEILTDTARIKIHVHVPRVDYDLEEISSNNITLTKKFRLTNKGDPITDLTISVADNLKENAYIEPAIEHYRLGEGASVEFNVVPLLSSADFQPASPAPPVEGDIAVNAAGIEVREQLCFTIPEGKQPYKAVVSSSGVIKVGQVKCHHCNNRPNTKKPFDIPPEIKDKIRDDPLVMKFSAPGWEVRPHDLYISVNGHEVGSLINTIPEGYYKFEVDPSFLIYPERGVAKNYIELHSVHQNGGHYLVSSDVEVRFNLENYETWVIATSQEEANQIAADNLPPGFYESPDSITVAEVDIAPEESSSALLGATSATPQVYIGQETRIQIGVTVDPPADVPLDVWATFTNGDSAVHLTKVGENVYEGKWTPRKPGNPYCDITIYVKGSGVQGTETKTVEIVNPTKLDITITEPPDGTKISQIERWGVFGGDYFGVQPVRVTVTDDAGSQITLSDVLLLDGVLITKRDGSVTPQSLSGWVDEGNGRFRCDWTPSCPGHYEITVGVQDSTDLNREGATHSVRGTLEEAELKITNVRGPSGTIDPYHDNYDQLKGELWNNGDRANRQSKKYPIEFAINRKAKVEYSIWDNSGWFAEEVPGAGEDLGVLDPGTYTKYLDLSKLDGGDQVWRKSSKPYYVYIKATDDQDPDKEAENDDIKFNIQHEPFFILLDDVAEFYKARISKDFANKLAQAGKALISYFITFIPIAGKAQDAVQALDGVFAAVVEKKEVPGLGKDDTVYYYRWRVMPYSWDTKSHTYVKKWVNPLSDFPGISHHPYDIGAKEISGPLTMKAFLVNREAIVKTKTGPTEWVREIKDLELARQFWAPDTFGKGDFIKKGTEDFPWTFDVETTTMGSPVEAKYVRDFPSQYHYPIFIYGLFGQPQRRSWGKSPKLTRLTMVTKGGKSIIGGTHGRGIGAPTNTENHDIAVSSLDEKMSFIIRWVETETELDLVLYQPDRTKVDPAYAEGDPNIDYYAYEGFRHYRVQNPEPGTWAMEVEGPVGITYRYDAYVIDTELVLAPLVEKELYDPGEEIHLSASLLHEDQPLTNATVTAEILRPDITSETVTLYDDGSHDDGEADDGVYANVYTNTSLEGKYEVEIRASGTLSGEDSFSRTVSLELLVQDEPVVTINSVYDGMEVAGTVPIEVSAVSASAAISSYEIWIDYAKACDTNLYLWNTLSDDGAHSITAKATDADGHTGETAINVTVSNPSGDGQAPEAPTGLSVSAVETGNALRLSWNANTETDLTGYNIYRSSTSGGPYTKVISVAETEYIDDGLTGGETYYYVVTALDYALNESGYSSEASGTASSPEQGFIGEYSDQGLDTNANGLFDHLAIDVGLTMAIPGHYYLVGNLIDHESAPVTGPFEYSFDLDAGNQTAQLLFPGQLIYEHGVDGTYNLTDLSLLDANRNQIDFEAEAYTTSWYNFTDFEPSLVGFTDSYSDFGTDTDGDGLYDILTVDVGINVAEAGDYIVTGVLEDGAGGEIDAASYFSSEHFGASAAGNHSIPLEFNGISVRKHGVDGPYYLKELSLFSQEAATLIAYRSEPYTTAAYSYTDFQKPAVAFTGNFSDYGTDTDSDGKYDYLTIDVGVCVENEGGYNITGKLEDSDGNEIVTATNTTSIAGNQTVQLDFDGLIISGHRVDGPYKLKDLLIYNVEDPSMFDFLSHAYTTSAYNFSDFQTPPLDLTLSPTDIIFSNDAPKGGEQITISATIHNDGTVDADEVVVQFFDGNAEAGGVQIEAEQTISSITPESTGTAQVNWTAISGTHDIFVRVDPYNSILEANENNNQASKQIIVSGIGNNPPNAPSDPLPANNATGVSIPVTLSVLVTDPDGDAMTVTFYDASDDSVIGTPQAGVASGSRAELVWSGLAINTTYSWYTKANDGEFDSPQSDTWDFTTGEEDCLWLDESPKSGSVEPGGSHNITISINTTGVASDYTAEIIISSNDPDDPEVIVPVTLRIWDPWAYDENNSNYIEIGELLQAINDYIGGKITISQLLQVINLYISHTPKP